MPEISVKTKLMSFALPILILLGGVVAGSIVIYSKPEIVQEPVEVLARKVSTVIATSRPVQVVVYAQGSVEAKQLINFIPQVSGEISYVSDKFVTGGRFQKGELILIIDPKDYELAVISSEAVVADALSQLETARAQADQALADWELLGRDAPTALALRRPQLASAEAKLKSAEAELQKVQLMLERTRIVAPFDGLLTNKAVDYGQYVTAGSNLGEFSSTDVMEVRLSLADSEISKLDIDRLNQGDGINVMLSAISGGRVNQWHGKIVRSEGTVSTKTRNLFVVAQLSNGELIADDNKTRLIIGLFVAAEIEGLDYERIYEIPRVALHNGDSVYIIDKESRLRSRKVDMVEVNSESILIVGGINEGDIISVSPMTNSVEGVLVEALVKESVDERNGS